MPDVRMLWMLDAPSNQDLSRTASSGCPGWRATATRTAMSELMATLDPTFIVALGMTFGTMIVSFAYLLAR
jgi:cephalosporin hydroxylase